MTFQSDPHQWKVIFWLTAGILTAVAVVFNIFGTAEKQDWNEGSEENGKSLAGSSQGVTEERFAEKC